MIADGQTTSSVRVKLGSKVVHPISKTATQEDKYQDNNNDNGLDSAQFESDSDNKNRKMEHRARAKTDHQKQLKGMEEYIGIQVKEIALMEKKIKALEDKAESYKVHPENWFNDRNVRIQIKGKRSKIIDKLWEMYDTLEVQDIELKDLKTAKNTLSNSFLVVALESMEYKRI